MSMIEQVSLGVTDDRRAGRFWAEALGYVRRPPRYPADEWIVLEPPPGTTGVALAMDVSESPVTEFPRIHLDLHAGDRDLDDEVDRLLGLGADRVDWPHYPAVPEPGQLPYVVLADTEGNRFCVSGHRRAGTFFG
ncbi:VOC family protein [Micromonospora sp. NPDC049081]|uniref:VOC family protein n=1 Tax=Micromonospora sp. NPDC049081 TaxID=3155150 RepID=UPI0033ED2625